MMIILFIITAIMGSFISSGAIGYVFLCRLGLISTILACFLLSGEGLLSPIFLLFLSFVLFSFGVPLLSACFPDYSDWYFLKIDKMDLAIGCWYSLLCLDAFALGLYFSSRRVERHAETGQERFPMLESVSSLFEENRDTLLKICWFAVLVFGIICSCYAFQFTSISLQYGISEARSVVVNGPFVNLSRSLLVPSSLILLIFSKEKRPKIILFSALTAYGIMVAISGDRTEGMTVLVVLFVLWFREWGKDDKSNTNNKIFAIVVALLLAISFPIIAVFRTGVEIDGVNLGTLFAKILSEFGFNFYTICFQFSLGLPFLYGLTYLAAFSTLIPSSLDVMGLRSSVEMLNAETLFNQLMQNEHPWADFGLGYSMVAESWLNFGVFGVFVVFLFGYVLGHVCSLAYANPISKYFAYGTFWCMLTVARRGLNFPVAEMKYIILLPIVICIAIKLLSSLNGLKRSVHEKR